MEAEQCEESALWVPLASAWYEVLEEEQGEKSIGKGEQWWLQGFNITCQNPSEGGEALGMKGNGSIGAFVAYRVN